MITESSSEPSVDSSTELSTGPSAPSSVSVASSPSVVTTIAPEITTSGAGALLSMSSLIGWTIGISFFLALSI